MSLGLLKQLGGGAVGLIIGFLILGRLNPEYDAFRLFHGRQDVVQVQTVKRVPLPQQPTSSRNLEPRELPEQPNKKRISSNSSPVVSPPPKLEINPDNIPPAAPVTDVPEAIELPNRGSTEVLEIARIAEPLDIQLRNPEGNHGKFQVSLDDARNTWSIRNGDQIVAALARDGDLFKFSWASDAPPTAESLRNAVLSLHVGGTEKKMLLRTFAKREPVIVDLTQATMALPLDLELWGLDPGQLQLELEEMTSTPSPIRFDPDSRRCPAGKTVRVILRDRAPCAALDVGVTTVGGKTSLNICPLLADKKDQLPWTIDRINTMYRTLKSDSKDANATIPQLTQDIEEANNDIRTLQSITGNANDARARTAQTSIAALRERIAAAQANIAAMQQGLRTWPAQMKVLKELADLGNQIQQNAKIAVRIFFVVDGDEVDVYRAG